MKYLVSSARPSVDTISGCRIRNVRRAPVPLFIDPIMRLLFYGMWMGCIILNFDLILGLKCFLNMERVYNIILFARVENKYYVNG